MMAPVGWILAARNGQPPAHKFVSSKTKSAHLSLRWRLVMPYYKIIFVNPILRQNLRNSIGVGSLHVKLPYSSFRPQAARRP